MKFTAIGKKRDALVAAVADGHGGAQYVRSEIGARLAVEVANRVASEWIGEVTVRDSDDFVLSSLRQVLIPAIVAEWRAAVSADLVARPMFKATTDSMSTYGTTLIVAVAFGERVAIAQIGDGDVIVTDYAGRTHLPIPGDPDLVAGYTASLCGHAPEVEFRSALVDGKNLPRIVILGTDGFGNSFADAGWRQIVAAELSEQIRDGAPSLVHETIAEWLTESALVAGDDATLCVMTREVFGE